MTTRAERLAFCRKMAPIYRTQARQDTAWTYRRLNANFYLQIKRGIARTKP